MIGTTLTRHLDILPNFKSGLWVSWPHPVNADALNNAMDTHLISNGSFLAKTALRSLLIPRRGDVDWRKIMAPNQPVDRTAKHDNRD